jgi:peptidoglycan/xylan/chitin deacetylase (PgdA/CDA1 family)
MNQNVQLKSLIILNFHHVSEVQSAGSLLTVSKQILEQHFDILKESAVPVISLKDVSTDAITSEFAVGITIDDGCMSDYEIVRPLLQTHNFPASFFPIVNQIGQNGKMNWSHLKQLHEAGYEIGSHGLSHDILTRMPSEMQHEELLNSKKNIEYNLGQEIQSFAFPYGRYDNILLEKAKQAGYKRTYTTGLKINKVAEPGGLFFRWNITNKTQPDLLKQVLSSNGLISPALEVHSRLKAFAQRMMDKK